MSVGEGQAGIAHLPWFKRNLYWEGMFPVLPAEKQGRCFRGRLSHSPRAGKSLLGVITCTCQAEGRPGGKGPTLARG